MYAIYIFTYQKECIGDPLLQRHTLTSEENDKNKSPPPDKIKLDDT